MESMKWDKLLTAQRLRKDTPEDTKKHRNPFEKDYDRIVFSTAFRRLKDKTQVYSLAKNDYVRTRLSHSIEVSCVGRTLGNTIGYEIVERYGSILKGIQPSYFGDIVAAACLAHDIGNPPFGHSGEDAIGEAFKASKFDGKGDLLPGRKQDFEKFEGNAQGFRVLTTLEMHPREGGMRLTCPTLAAYMKYPRESDISKDDLEASPARKSISKHGFHQSEKDLYSEIANVLGLIRRKDNIAWWARHPLAFLVEAADDICYRIVDVEDACRMGFIPFSQAKELIDRIAHTDLTPFHESEDEQLKRLRAYAIGS